MRLEAFKVDEYDETDRQWIVKRGHRVIWRGKAEDASEAVLFAMESEFDAEEYRREAAREERLIGNE